MPATATHDKQSDCREEKWPPKVNQHPTWPQVPPQSTITAADILHALNCPSILQQGRPKCIHSSHGHHSMRNPICAGMGQLWVAAQSPHKKSVTIEFVNNWCRFYSSLDYTGQVLCFCTIHCDMRNSGDANGQLCWYWRIWGLVDTWLVRIESWQKK